MRRYSQRNSLSTLSEINITPLLDLAFRAPDHFHDHDAAPGKQRESGHPIERGGE